jgi:hypothetical protein
MSFQLLQLLLKASQDKRFVCEEAERTLRGMTTSISPQPMLQKLQPYVNHRNPRVRAKAAMCMYNSVSRLVCPFGMLAHSLCCQSKMSKPNWFISWAFYNSTGLLSAITLCCEHTKSGNSWSQLLSVIWFLVYAPYLSISIWKHQAASLH